MTLEEAMTDLSIQMAVNRQLGETRKAMADQLGIEALKQMIRMRGYDELPDGWLLPGETWE